MPEWQDDLGRSLHLAGPPQRIVSLCPSQTETLFALGLGERIVGLTRYCVHPSAKATPPPSPSRKGRGEKNFPSPLWRGGGERVESKVKVGGTKQLDFAAIERLNPDLIIAEKEENRREDVERLSERWPVYVTDVRDFDSALRMIEALGRLCGSAGPAQAMTEQIAARWAAFKPSAISQRTVYLIWRKPFMVAGSGTYIHSVLERCGLRSQIAAPRYPELSIADLKRLEPELLLLSSEPYPFREKHVAELAALLPDARIELVNGEMFSWYGVRMLAAADYLEDWLARLAA